MKIRLGLSHIEMVRVITKEISKSFRNSNSNILQQQFLENDVLYVIDELSKIGIKSSSNRIHPNLNIYR